MKYSKLNIKKAAGFTLVELIFVLALVGIFAYFFVGGSKGAEDQAKAIALNKLATSMTNVFVLANMSCSTTSNIESSPLSTLGNSTGAVTLILTGAGVNPAYEGCFDSSGAKPLNGASRGSAGVEKVAGYNVSATMATANKINWTFLNVPEKVALAAYKKYSSAAGADASTSLPSGGDSSDPYFRFSPVSSGTTNLTFVESI